MTIHWIKHTKHKELRFQTPGTPRPRFSTYLSNISIFKADSTKLTFSTLAGPPYLNFKSTKWLKSFGTKFQKQHQQYTTEDFLETNIYKLRIEWPRNRKNGLTFMPACKNKKVHIRMEIIFYAFDRKLLCWLTSSMTMTNLRNIWKFKRKHNTISRSPWNNLRDKMMRYKQYA